MIVQDIRSCRLLKLLTFFHALWYAENIPKFALFAGQSRNPTGHWHCPPLACHTPCPSPEAAHLTLQQALAYYHRGGHHLEVHRTVLQPYSAKVYRVAGHTLRCVFLVPTLACCVFGALPERTCNAVYRCTLWEKVHKIKRLRRVAQMKYN